MGHQHSSGRHGFAGRQRHRRTRRQNLRGEVRGVPRRRRQGRHQCTGGGGPPIKSIDATKTVANFWGYSTTVFDYVRRAMPWMSPRTLTDDEVYALTAFILAQNKIIGDNDVMNAQTLPKVKMPNADNFIIKFPDKI